ncbi:MAG TPA: DNA-processing protein DprA [Bryobacteraceae bacterium]|nr:DNA-processing protein DprA [Bryobacteraceae bacterium]HOQ47415.1 DNA-processing protein DprA [Bryobacteraceae bacterium]HPQ14167.1 DNA-processing protein DprA [Bryobacteraceae bacterium]HPU73169.1 DNA-processing protein DprA [Bryobacteraceae bacterium]
MTVSTLTREEELDWLALTLVPGLGARTAGKLLARFRTPREVLRASRTELEASGIAGSVAQSIASGCSYEDAAAQQEKMLQAGAVLVTLADPRYPARLREIFDPPIVLFARGRTELLNSLCLGIVGTRRPTPYGLNVTERLSGDLARAGLTIVSGMARGVDTAAHRGALAAGGDTIAVLGCGVDVVYPSENRRLAAEIASRGLIISEFPMGAPAYPQNFPIRNRIISGLSLGVLVTEGAQYSGSAITARLALDQGREVFAVPGSIVSKMSWGPNLLIKQGAKLVQDWNDVVEELPAEERRLLAERKQGRLFGGSDETGGEQQASNTGENLSPIARKILGLLKVETATHIDDLLERAEDVSSSEVIAALFELELLGVVRQLPGKNFAKVW